MGVMDTRRRTGQRVDLWALALRGGEIAPAELAAAVEARLLEGELDFRSRVLVRDALRALAQYWGDERLARWREQSPAGARALMILGEDLGEPGFPSLGHRLMDSTKADVVMQFLRELGLSVSEESSFVIGGAIALILAHRLSRHTEDVDVVDEVPAGIRQQHELLTRLAQRYGLHLTHFQSDYLPSGWEERLHSVGQFGKLRVFRVDEYDVAVGKLFSNREKDRDDLRVLGLQLDKAILTDRLRSSGQGLLKEAELAAHARDNWWIVFGETLPA